MITATSFLGVGKTQSLQRIRNGLQVPLRQVQILSGSFQIGVAKQNLDGAQIGTGFE